MSMKTIISTAIAVTFLGPALADDFPALDAALPASVDAVSIAPVFDFDGDGCLPAAGISRDGVQNAGLKPTGSITGSCRSANFLQLSNTVHRYACKYSGGATYCGHFYSLYFEKDQILSGIESGHRHDWENAAVWTKNGVVTHGSYSAHGDLTTDSAANLEFQGGHLKIVYHKDGITTHAFRFAKENEVAENPYGRFVTPPIISWYEFSGDGWPNLVMRNLLNNYDYGSANLPVREGAFLSDLNEFKPLGYPTFNQTDVEAANPQKQDVFNQYINKASDLCLDVSAGTMANGSNVMLWPCNGERWQKWYHDTSTGLIHNLQDPRYCLDNSSTFANGASMIIWTCWGGKSQRFVNNGKASFGMASDPTMVLDGNGTAYGSDAVLWGYWGGSNQQWILN